MKAFIHLGVVGGGRGIGRGDSLGVLSSSLVGHISNISIITIGGVGDMLDSAVRKGNRVGSLGIAGTIRGLLSVEVGLGVVISNSVGVGVGGDLIGVDLSLVGGGRGMVSGGSMGNDRGSVDSVGNNRGGVDSVSNDGGGVDGVGNGVGDHGGVDSVGNRGVHSVDGVGHGGVDSVGNGVGNHRGVDSVGNSRSDVGGEVASGDDGSSVAEGGVVRHISGSQAEEGGNDESLKPITC